MRSRTDVKVYFAILPVRGFAVAGERSRLFCPGRYPVPFPDFRVAFWRRLCGTVAEGLTRLPVTQENAGSSPAGLANLGPWRKRRSQSCSWERRGGRLWR